jgi:hypothetical protein
VTGPENPEQGPLNEWRFDEYIRTKDALADLIRRHEQIINTLADVCRRNDRMRGVGDEMVDCIDRLAVTLNADQQNHLDGVIQKWREANV